MSIYFENDENLKDKKQLIKIKLEDEEYHFYTNLGVFSKNKLDYGTRLLLETIDVKKGEGLDLGCGYGIIGIVLAYNKELTMDMVDINTRALNLACENAKLNNCNNVNIYESNIYDNVNKKYDFIITNPPIRAGKEIIRKFLIGAKDYLKENGTLWFVMRKDHGVKTMIEELKQYYKVEVVKKDKGFYIVKCL